MQLKWVELTSHSKATYSCYEDFKPAIFQDVVIVNNQRLFQVSSVIFDIYTEVLRLSIDNYQLIIFLIKW